MTVVDVKRQRYHLDGEVVEVVYILNESETTSRKMSYRVDVLIERHIEGYWFVGTIRDVYAKKNQLRIQYVDDGKIEDSVPYDEVRLYKEDCKSGIQYGKSVINSLPKPLAGLVEDDSEIRTMHVPTAVVHQSVETEEAIIINGEDSKLAAGGGLRALRFLNSYSQNSDNASTVSRK